MAKVENLNSPMGWLRDPHNKWAIHFDVKNASSDDTGAYFTLDMWGIVPGGKPMVFKSRRKVTRKDSLKTWNQLIAANWVALNVEKIKSA